MRDYLTRRTDRVTGPSALLLETTVRCNLLCPMCPRTGAGYGNNDMPTEMLHRLLDDHARLGGDHVYLYGLGEPLLDKRIFDLVARCERLGLHSILSTNATLLTPPRRSALLDSACDHLLIGIDGTTAETYEYYRTGGNYETVVANVRALAAEKVERGASLAIVVQFIRMAKNQHQADDFVRMWKGVPGVNEVRVKEEDIGLPEHRTYAVEGHLRDNPCHLLWRGPMVVRYDGTVYACYHHASEGEPVGNLSEQSLGEIWNSERMVELRTLHVTGQAGRDSSCATCPAARPKLPFVLGAMALRGRTVRRLMPIAERASLRYPWLFSENRTSKM
ncbi:MAG: radical SAM protein with 4Fe4S-binding SPASM domain [Myxococcota bacterium]|jgi:radical SAM protein with 4Fe4S-binding SPASM domain